jgi:hypothetical protein
VFICFLYRSEFVLQFIIDVWRLLAEGHLLAAVESHVLICCETCAPPLILGSRGTGSCSRLLRIVNFKRFQVGQVKLRILC